MALDDVIGAGSKAKKVEAYRIKFEESGGSLNAALDYAKIEGMDKSNPAGYAALRAHAADMTPARQRETLEAYVGEVIEEVIGITLPKAREAIEGTKPEVLRAYLLNKKPVNYKGADPEVFGAYEGAVKARKLLSDEKELGKAVKSYQEKVIGATKKNSLKGAIAWVLNNNPDISVGAVQKDASEKIKKFEGVEAQKLTSYAVGRYQSLDDKAKKPEAYEIAKALADSQ